MNCKHQKPVTRFKKMNSLPRIPRTHVPDFTPEEIAEYVPVIMREHALKEELFKLSDQAEELIEAVRETDSQSFTADPVDVLLAPLREEIATIILKRINNMMIDSMIRVDAVKNQIWDNYPEHNFSMEDVFKKYCE